MKIVKFMGFLFLSPPILTATEHATTKIGI